MSGYRQMPRRKIPPTIGSVVVVVPLVSTWVHPVNQPQTRRKARVISIPGGGISSTSSATIPSGWIQPVSQPLRKRIKQRQQPNYNFPPPLRTFVAPPVPLGWLRTVSQPRIVKRRQQPQPYGNFSVTLPPVVANILVSMWKQPTTQPLRYRKKTRQQPIYADRGKYFPIPNPVIPPPDPISLTLSSKSQNSIFSSPAHVEILSSDATIDTIASEDTGVDLSR